MNLRDWFHSLCGGRGLGGQAFGKAARFSSARLRASAPRKSVGAFLFVAIGALTQAASATPITYTIPSETLTGNSGSFVLTGTITTDGTIGPLSASDITSWQWQLTNGSTTYSDSGPPNISVTASGLTATATALTLPFNPPPMSPAVVDPGGSILLQPNIDQSNLEIITATLNVTGLDYNYYTQVDIASGPSFTRSVDYGATDPSGSLQVIATAAPEPSSVVLLALGAMALVLTFAGRRIRARMA